jgi:hypothetical protein
MNRRFVIAVEGLTSDEQDEFRQFLAAHGSWRHWVDNFWLLSITSGDEIISVGLIRDRIKEINYDTRAIVFEFPEDISWATLGKMNAKGRRMADWLKSTWAKE